MNSSAGAQLGQLRTSGANGDSHIKEEKCKIEGVEISLPEEVLLADLSAIFNLEVWNSLTEEERSKLRKYLPTSVYTKETEQELLRRLFDRENFLFGNPVTIFEKNLRRGYYQEQLAAMRKATRELQYASYVYFLRDYHRAMLQRIVRYKEALGIETKLDFLVTNDLPSETEVSSEGEEGSATDTDTEVKKLKVLPLRHEQSPLQPLVFIPEPQIPAPAAALAPPPTNHKKRLSAAEPESGEVPKKVPKKVQSLMVSAEYISRKDIVQEEYVSPYILFTSIKRLLASQSLTSAEIAEKLSQIVSDRIWLPPYTRAELVTIGMNFLTSPPALPLSVKTGPPQSTAPVVRFDSKSKTWTWLREVPDTELQSFEQLLYLSVSRGHVDPTHSWVTDTNYKLPKSQPTISPSSPAEREQFRQLEAERYKAWESPWIWEIGPIRSAVAPVKKGTGFGTKAREHPLLKGDRPPQINVLSLVRDAAARLPGGIGTRPDVALLLKDSQYLRPDAPDKEIAAAVSGALDRLHSDPDPPVRYDTDQKLWIYVHRLRTIEDFLEREQEKKREKERRRAAERERKPVPAPPLPTAQPTGEAHA